MIFGARWARAAMLVCAAACMSQLVTLQSAHAIYPERPVKVVIPYAAGGVNDVVARLLSVPLGEALGQPIVIENRTGAGSNVGTGSVARAEPDGYTLLMSAGAFTINPSLYRRIPYDPIKDFESVAEIAYFPILIAAQPNIGISKLGDLIAKAKAAPGSLNYSSPGAGTVSQLMVEALKLHSHLDIVHVPYAGAGPGLQAILTGTVELGAVSVSAAVPMIRAGKLVGLVVLGEERWPDLPEVPTMAEAGLPNFDSWQGLFAPAGTPREIVDRLAEATRAVLRQPDIRQKLLAIGVAAADKGPQQLRARVLREVPMWRDFLEKTGIKLEQ